MQAILDYLNENPALLSILAFPFGIVLLALALKHVGFYKLLKDLLEALNAHTAAEVKIEARLTEVVSEIKQVIDTTERDRVFFEGVLGEFRGRLERCQESLMTILTLAKKRQSDWIRPPKTEVFRRESDQQK